MCTKFERIIIEIEEEIEEIEEVKGKTLRWLKDNGKISTRLHNGLVRGFTYWRWYNHVANNIDPRDCTIEYLWNTMGEAYITKIRYIGEKALAELKSLL